MNYLLAEGFDESEIKSLEQTLKKNILEQIILFPTIVKVNYQILKELGIKNFKEIFMEHTHMFLMNPNKFKAIFDKYDQADLVRCLEKNGAVIEKL